MPSVTMTLQEYQELQHTIQKKEEELKQANHHTEQARSANFQAMEKELQEVVLLSLDIVQFTIANHDPSLRGWPYEALMDLATKLGAIPVPHELRDAYLDLQDFAREAKRFSEKRAKTHPLTDDKPVDVDSSSR